MNKQYLEELITRRPEMVGICPDIQSACSIIIESYKKGGKVITCGNGGSCSDADHIVGELMKGFMKKRSISDEIKSVITKYGEQDLSEKLQSPLRAINLCSMPALSTAFANDVEPEYVYAQLALGYTDPEDVFIGISTSGNSKSVHYAAVTAKAVGARLIGLTGAEGGKMEESGLYDMVIRAPEKVTHCVQEAHVAIYHAICLTVEEWFY